MQKNILIIVPVLNEAKNIKPLINKIFIKLKKEKKELLFIDDNSTDGTRQEIINFQNRFKNTIHLIKREKKLGIGSAHKCGLKWGYKKKYKIIMEENAFSSDRYVVNSQLKLHGYNESDIILLKTSNDLINEEYIIETIEKNKDDVCMVLLPGIQYYTGQQFDLKKISIKCRECNITFGVDFAHAIGNVKINLNDIDLDFATWCSYKYLNSGPGGISGIYVNSRNLNNDMFRLEGWWGNKLSTRFEMRKQCDIDSTAEGWVISNPPVILLDIHLASIEVFKKIGLDELFSKSKSLTKFLYDGLTNISNYRNYFKILTPEDPERRGAQLSLYFLENSEVIFEKLNKKFVIDYRKPNVLRIAPVPLYNSYEEVYMFVEELKGILNEIK